MIQNNGQPQLNEDGSITTPDPSDTHTDVPMSREEPRQRLENIVSNSIRQNPLTKPTIDSLLDLLAQARKDGAVEALEKARNALEGFNDGCGCCSDQMAESKIDYLISQYQDKEKETR